MWQAAIDPDGEKWQQTIAENGITSLLRPAARRERFAEARTCLRCGPAGAILAGAAVRQQDGRM